ncbi:MAG: Kelch repeat-containing protein [Anaerolineaceae bacterium]|jgi:N-acetylneuraminic acid mutarotase
MKKAKHWIVVVVFLLLQVLAGAALVTQSAQGITPEIEQVTETGIASGTAVIGEASGGIKPEDIGESWEVMAPLPEGRVFNAVIAHGMYVYVIGGTSDGGGFTPTATNFRYNTSDNTWKTMTAMPAALDSIDGAVIGSKIYIPGGESDSNTYVYNIASDSWTNIPANGGYAGRSQYQVVTIGTDLYVLGGLVGSSSTSEVWKLDTITQTWSAGVPMQKSRTSFAAAAINGAIYVAGGVAYPGFTPDMTAEKFDGTAWSYIAGLPDGGGAYTRWSYMADGNTADRMWLAGGRRDAAWDVLNHAAYYDPALDTWTDSPTIPVLNQARVYVEGVVADNGYFYVIGGRASDASVAYDTNERLKVFTPGEAWEVMAPLPEVRVFNAVIAHGAYVYVIGGTSDGGGNVPTSTNFRYNTSDNTWKTMTAMPAALDSIDGAVIGGKIYIPGDGSDSNTYVYDIAADNWTTIPANGGYSGRWQYQVVAIGTDLYVLGGLVGSSSTSEVWRLDTITQTWSAGVSMQKSRTSFAAAAINGAIYVAGGVAFPSFTPDMTAEKFDGTAWSYIAGVPDGGGAYTRWSYMADGNTEDRMWLAGGRRDAAWAVLNHAAYYNPASDTWTDSPTIPVLNQGRVYTEGVVADDGYFYVIGGRAPDGSVAYDTNERLKVFTPGEVTFVNLYLPLIVK